MVNYDLLTLGDILDSFENRGWEFVCNGDTKRAVLSVRLKGRK